MDYMLFWNSLIIYLLTLVQVVSSSSIALSPLSGRTDPKRGLQHCSLKCPNGYDTDIEGNPFCRCSDPCANVFCPGEWSCVVVQRKRCRNGPCKARAVCKDRRKTYRNDILKQGIQNDGTVTPPSTCTHSLPVPESAFNCKRKRRRWFFDEEKGACVKIKVCKGAGVGFTKKRTCKKMCQKKRKQARKNRKGKRRNRTKVKTQNTFLESKTPDVTEIKFPVSKPARVFSAFSAPGVYYTARCPPDKPKVNCPYNPCESCRDFYVLCEINLCGKCSANYFHRKTGQPLRKCNVWST